MGCFFLQNKTCVSFPLFFTFQDESTQYLAFSLRSVHLNSSKNPHTTKTVNKTWPAIPLNVTKEDFGGQ